ncbi:protein lifeguard 3 isoform X2 [Scaptodrosophila lebanonensis]|uniref:Protein lifeguard 3 isoform X2 n=1 Tax=Drosophila lebanonensis TaxID=7225 RepID=A0A6J2U8C4_DROLE|nr:protein lifeguard 3 isoform X2 [Scaptodrosophila lebanonensis]
MPRRERDNFGEEWDDDYTRRAFITKVLSIVGLAFTAAVVAVFTLVEPAQNFLIKYFWLVFVCMGVMFITMIALVCCIKVARSVPCNYILLIIFTIASAIVTSYTALRFAPIQVLTALGATIVVVIFLGLFAAFAPCDFTGCGLLICVLVMGLFVMCIVGIFVRTRTMMWIIAVAGVIIFSLVLIFDLQLMIGGKHKNQYSEEDYVIAALSIYVDIIMLFQYILEIIGLIDG